MKATIICPTYNHGRLIHTAMRSVLRQTHQDFEVFIIGDGVTEETRQAVMEVLAWDERIRFIDREKSPRHGELYRHEILTTLATGEAVCYISDDDLWMPEHLATMVETLATVDVAHARNVFVAPDGTLATSMVDWEAENWREWMIQPPWKNVVGLSQAGHRMSAYRCLPHGWRTTPAGRWSDHYMWQQFLELPWVRAAGTGEISVVMFPSPQRREMSIPERIAEVASWEDRMQDPAKLRRELIVAAANWGALMDNHVRNLTVMVESQHSSIEQLNSQIQSMDEQIHSLQAQLGSCHHKEEAWRVSAESRGGRIEALQKQRDEGKKKLKVAKQELAAIKKAGARLPRWLRALNRMFGGMR